MKRFLIIELEYTAVSTTDDAILANRLAINPDGLYSVIDMEAETVLNDGINGTLEVGGFDASSVDEDGYPLDTVVPPAEGDSEGGEEEN